MLPANATAAWPVESTRDRHSMTDIGLDFAAIR
jgi:hypothetical protein